MEMSTFAQGQVWVSSLQERSRVLKHLRNSIFLRVVSSPMLLLKSLQYKPLSLISPPATPTWILILLEPTFIMLAATLKLSSLLSMMEPLSLPHLLRSWLSPPLPPTSRLVLSLISSPPSPARTWTPATYGKCKAKMLTHSCMASDKTTDYFKWLPKHRLTSIFERQCHCSGCQPNWCKYSTPVWPFHGYQLSIIDSVVLRYHWRLRPRLVIDCLSRAFHRFRYCLQECIPHCLPSQHLLRSFGSLLGKPNKYLQIRPNCSNCCIWIGVGMARCFHRQRRSYQHQGGCSCHRCHRYRWRAKLERSPYLLQLCSRRSVSRQHVHQQSRSAPDLEEEIRPYQQ